MVLIVVEEMQIYCTMPRNSHIFFLHNLFLESLEALVDPERQFGLESLEDQERLEYLVHLVNLGPLVGLEGNISYLHDTYFHPTLKGRICP